MRPPRWKSPGYAHMVAKYGGGLIEAALPVAVLPSAAGPPPLVIGG